jgi:thiamine pyrophosphate-dependent acetolactate synthase large subunit-like protein
MGVTAATIVEPADVPAALARSMRTDGPTLLEVMVDGSV